MEAIFFLIDIIAVILLLYWSIENDKRGPDAPSSGLFAYKHHVTQQPKGPVRRGRTPPRRRGR